MNREEEIIKASVANERQGKLRVFGGSGIVSDEDYILFNKNNDFIAVLNGYLSRWKRTLI